MRQRNLRRRVAAALRFRSSHAYWEDRYAAGGTSGPGSYAAQARYKADFLNRFVRENRIASVVEFGCGDGNQLALAEYPRYLGLDVAASAVKRCIETFRHDGSKSFMACDLRFVADRARFLHAELGLSLDVVFHLVEDDVFEAYMHGLFAASDRFVVIYASDREARDLGRHVRWRTFTPWIEKSVTGWELLRLEPAPIAEYQDFHVFRRVGTE
ncbi:MAG TPA: class I SAM-dependent methyltransferase [Gaiellaceae bacterium]|nr:class I SAM-dependent methyltransferase [Gaiellaceae bacterium]